MAKKMDKNKILRGTFGAVWLNNEELGAAKSFEAKITLEYEDIDIAGDLGKHKRYIGFTGEGTMTLHKIDSSIAELLHEGIRTGDIPDIKLVGKLEDPTGYGAERVEFTGVTINEVMALKWANKEIREEEVPFSFSGYRFIDLIK